MKEPIYRRAVLSDIPQLCALGLASYGQFKQTLGEEWKKMEAGIGNSQTYTKLLEVGVGFVCEQNDKLLGMAFLVPRNNPVGFFEAGWSYIRLVGVLPEHGGQGIGKELTKLCIKQAKESGEEIIALHTSEFQNAARHIYETIGFTKLKEIDKLFNKRYWIYTLNLKA
ncbi:GNAT family N-acetyltransferase [Sphingobacteriaceae bacterium]|nr:GNAT family N-acetyltransferase [Sphingobacteriaceae bacterium]